LLTDVLKVVFIFLVAVVILSATAYFGVRYVIKGQQTEVPNVVGKSFMEAFDILNESGLRVKKMEQRKYSAGLPKDYVVDQRPVPSQKVKIGREIKLYLSRGAEAGAVPRLIGQTVSEAESVINSVGMELGSVTRVHSDVFPQAGIIIAHTPLANMTVQRGIKLNLLVSLGTYSMQLTVPDLGGMKLQDALELLEFSSLRAGRIEREASPAVAEADIVLEQAPQPNERAEKGTPVDMVVSLAGGITGDTTRLAVLRYRVPSKSVSSDNPDEAYSSGTRQVRIVLEHDGGMRTIVDKEFPPEKWLEYPLRITGRGIAKIYLDETSWPVEIMISEWPSKEFASQQE